MQHFMLWVKTMGIGINDQALLKTQPHRVCVDCARPEAALGSGALPWWCRAHGFHVSHSDRSH